MAERLPKATFDELGRHIWRIAELGMREAIEIAPMPAMLAKSFHFGKSGLDIAIELDEDSITGVKDPQWLSAKITKAEPYEPHPKFDLQTAKVLELDLGGRTKKYYTEVDIVHDDEETHIIPLAALPHRTTVVAPDAWKTISKRTLTVFGPEEAEYFLTHLTTFAERLKQDL